MRPSWEEQDLMESSGMLWEEGNWAARSEGRERGLLICYCVSPGCSNVTLIFLRGAEGLHSWVCFPLLHMPQRGSWSANARTFPDSWCLTASCYLGLFTVLKKWQQSVTHHEFSEKPLQSFSKQNAPSYHPTQTRETFLADEQLNAVLGNDPNISIFQAWVLRREQSQGARRGGVKAYVCQRCMAGPAEGLCEAWHDRRQFHTLLMVRPVFRPGRIPLRHLFQLQEIQWVPATATAIPWDPMQTHPPLCSPAGLTTCEGKANSQHPSVGPERLGVNPLGGYPVGSFLSAFRTRCQRHTPLSSFFLFKETLFEFYFFFYLTNYDGWNPSSVSY